MDRSDSSPSGEGVNRCPVCGREFASEEELDDHVKDAGLLW